jgi:hypothetical protein
VSCKSSLVGLFPVRSQASAFDVLHDEWTAAGGGRQPAKLSCCRMGSFVGCACGNRSCVCLIAFGSWVQTDSKQQERDITLLPALPAAHRVGGC